MATGVMIGNKGTIGAALAMYHYAPLTCMHGLGMVVSNGNRVVRHTLVSGWKTSLTVQVNTFGNTHQAQEIVTSIVVKVHLQSW